MILKVWKWLWWVCVCRSKGVSWTDNSLTSSGMLFRVSSFTFDACSILLFPDAFSKEALIPTCSPCSEFADSRIPSRRCIYWPACSFNFRSNNAINSGQNWILYHVFNCINNIAHFPVISSIKTPFQGFHIHCTFLNR